MKKKKTKPASVRLITLQEPTSNISEQYRTIRTSINFASVDKQLKTLVVTSAGPGDGKSTTSANLAVAFADTGMNVLLVDADLRRATVHMSFQLPNHRGLSTLLSEKNSGVKEAIHHTNVDNLFVLTSGPKPPNPSELLGSHRMSRLIDQLASEFDLVIFDVPPVISLADAQLLSSKVDGTLLVLREGKTQRQNAVKAVERLKEAHSNIIGAVYNGVSKIEDDYYHYY
ncbi:hypothetical protein IGI44_002661 [Enterococcus sp. DIV0756]